MKQTTPYQLERARTYRAEAQRAIEYILSNDDFNKAKLILKSLKRSINAEINMSDDEESCLSPSTKTWTAKRMLFFSLK